MTTLRPILRPPLQPILRSVFDVGVGGGGAAGNEAAVVILLGQSLNAARGTVVKATPGWAGAYMPAGGVAVQDFAFFSLNQDFSANYASFASASPMSEGSGQSPCVGVASVLDGEIPGVERAYLVSVAVGSRGIETMMSRGIRPNIYAALHRLSDMARANGLTPRVVFYSAHGEADAAGNIAEQTYYDRAMAFYRGCQTAAAQAMRAPSYVAPMVLTYPVQTNAGDSGTRDRRIRNAIKRIGDDLPGAVMLGPAYQWPCEVDRVHPTPTSYVMRGEAVGRVIARMLNGDKHEPLTIKSVTLSGTTFVATFSHPVVRDDSLGVGSNLNTSFARDGLEWVDNGSYIAITELAYSGNTITGTLNSTPSGSIGQQELRVAVQSTTSALAAGPENLPGSLIRKTGEGWPSVIDPGYMNYDWASPQISGVASA